MATPSFVFADPALQAAVAQQAIAEAQLRGVQEQARAASLDRLSRDRETRAIRQSEIDRANRAQEQQDRQFNQSLAQREKEMISNADLYKTSQNDYRTALELKEKNALEIEKFNGLKALFKDTNNIPSPLEVKAEIQGMNPERAALLESLADNTRKLAMDAWKQGEMIRNKWANRIASLDPKKGETLESIIKAFNSDKDSQVVLFDGTSFVNRYKKPREDAVFGPEEAPAAGGDSVIRQFIDRKIAGAGDGTMTAQEFRARLGTPTPVPATPAQAIDYGAIQRALGGNMLQALPPPPLPPPAQDYFGYEPGTFRVPNP